MNEQKYVSEELRLVHPEICSDNLKQTFDIFDFPVDLEVSGYNIKQLEGLLTCNQSYCAVTAPNTSSKNLKVIVEKAAHLAI